MAAITGDRLSRGLRYGWLPALSLLGLLIGMTAPPGGLVGSFGGWWSVRALGRIALTSITAVTLLAGPGLGLRLLSKRRPVTLAVAIWVGPALLALLGVLAWLLYPVADPYRTVRIGAAVVLVALLIGCAFLRRPVLDRDESWLAGLCSLVFLTGLARSLWSVGPTGELYAGTIARTLEVGDRPDSRTSYLTVSLISHGYPPFGLVAHLLYYPYSFSDRGPLPGIIATPVVLLSGALPGGRFPTQPWTPFDQQGFMAYRITMMLLAITILPVGYAVASRLAGPRAGRLAAVLLAGTPFVLHEVYYTWPKLAAAALCLLAGYLVLTGRPVRAGLAIGAGYLMHPLALLSVPTLLLLGVLAAREPGTRLPPPRRLVGWTAGSLAGLAAVLLGWRLAQGSHYTQGKFLSYFRTADNVEHPSLAQWLTARAVSIGNTLVPLRLPIVDGDSRSINAVGPGNSRLPSGALVHFFFQYWTGLPFGVGIVFFPVLLGALYWFGRRNPLGTLVTVLVPFVVFAAYWGSFTSGLLREGLHPWVATLLVLAAVALATEFRSRLLRLLLVCCLLGRLVEALAMMTVTSVAGRHELVDHRWQSTDLAALTLLLAGFAGLAVITVREFGRLPVRDGTGPGRAGGTELGTGETELGRAKGGARAAHRAPDR
ncbi:MAG TPA: hypothetical protein VFD94_12450 [Jatrophihabitans sp.]|nr:hypothetical protein [Jatrophihabitans sp.]